ncbi:MAG: hypothetical protein AB7O38_31765, partial [Pirellulaceae bacterium]
MTQRQESPTDRTSTAGLDRRELLALSTIFGTAFLAAQGLVASDAPASRSPPRLVARRRAAPSRRYDMKKSINLWAFPYPQRWTLAECLEIAKDAGFDGVE